MEKFNFTYNGNTTMFTADTEKGISSIKWEIDPSFWGDAIKPQIKNMGVATNYLSNVSGKTPTDTLHEMFNEQVKYGGFTSETLDELAEEIIGSMSVSVTDEEFIEATLELIEWSNTWLKSLREQVLEQGIATDSQFVKELDAALWGLDLSSKMFKSKAA